MSLRVNLIKEGEQRSGSSLNVKSFARIASIVGPVSTALLIAQQALSSFMLSSQLSNLELQWSAEEPRKKLAIKQAERLNFNRATRKELDTWGAARADWNQILAAVMQAVPGTIQLTTFRAVLSDNPPASPPVGTVVRDYLLTLEGTTRGPQSMQNVETLQAHIRNHPFLALMLESVTVANFAADATSDDTASRIFTLTCKFKPLPHKEMH